jgi:hypothetical protein
MSWQTRLVALAGVGAALAASGVAQAACVGSGVITRIDGKPQDVAITRTANGPPTLVARPRVLEVICQGDTIRVAAPSSATLSVDGRGAIKVAGGSSFIVPTRSGAPSVAGNAYRELSEQVMPDMKRLAWNVRLKGEGEDFGFRLPTLSTGQQNLTAGRRALLVRLTGGAAPYKVDLKDASGAVVASATGANEAIVLPAAALSTGRYRLTASDSTPRTMTAELTVVAEPPPANGSFADMPDPEVRTAAAATALAQAHPGAWAFEAEQMLHASPANGLDRERVYELVESYGDQ